MIIVRDWIASIPDEDKHIAYVGEGSVERREFFLCGEGWEDYQDWSFHLDMAFDPESITTRDSRQVVHTQVETIKSVEETNEISTKESYTVNKEEVTWDNLTDIASLSKVVEADGIRLTWEVLRYHTCLPGKLWATIRAMGHGPTSQIKKSAIMVFEVDAAICAIPATCPPTSEFELMEQEMDALRQQAVDAAEAARSHAVFAEAAIEIAQRNAQKAVAAADTVATTADIVTTAANTATEAASDAADSARQADGSSVAAEAACNEALQHAEVAAEKAQFAGGALDRCFRYAFECSESANRLQTMQKAVNSLTYHRLSVRDYGAVGDGVTDDRAAIMATFEAAKSMLPCEVYFPAGTYGISNGITIEMAYGTGGLRVRGAGWDITTIKYLESYDPNQFGNQWYAIRIWPVGLPNTKPSNEDEWLHDISYTGLSVYDTDPIGHAWSTEKGDPNKEETHGFDVQYCKGVSVTDCKIDSVGDEAIDIYSCHDVVVANNHIFNSPAAGSSGGAISIGCGSKNVVVSGNTVNGSADDEVLADGTVITKRNFGIAVESLTIPVSDVVITGNTILNVRGNGVNIAATQAGSNVDNVLVTGNIIADCFSGVSVNDTLYHKGNISITNNMISGCGGSIDTDGYAIYTGTKTYNVLIAGNKIQDIAGAIAVRVGAADFALVSDNLFVNIAGQALYTTGDVSVRNCTFTNIGTDGAAKSAIEKYNSASYKLTVSGCKLTNIHSAKGIMYANVVENTDIQLANDGGMVLANTTHLSRIIGGQFNGYFRVDKDGAVVQGLTIYSENCSTDAITIAANGVSVTGCNIYVGTAKKAIKENDGFKGNLVANNVVNGKLSTGAVLILADNEGSVCVNNIDLRGLSA